MTLRLLLQRTAAVAASMILVVVLAGLMGQPGQAAAPQEHQHHQMSHQPRSSVPLRSNIRGPVPDASRTPTAAFDGSGRLWLAWVEGGFVLVSSSGDLGKTFSLATPVNAQPEDIDANSESRPKLAIGRNDEIFVSYTRLGQKPFTGDIRFSRSVDGGRSFSPPTTVNDDRLETGHRFDDLIVGPDEAVYVAWIDKRDLETAEAHRQPYPGAAVYYAVSTDRGASFSKNRKLKDNACECCRLALDFDTSGHLVVLWRDILPGGIRDHSLLHIFSDGSHDAPHPATRDGWAIDACPHHGPSLAIGEDGTYHVTWFTGEGPQGAGAFYARSIDQGRTFSEPMCLGPADAIAHAHTLVKGRHVFVIWKESIQPGGQAVVGRQSDDGGKTWSAPREIARTGRGSDHPFLVSNGGQVFLSWFTPTEGYRLIPLGE